MFWTIIGIAVVLYLGLILLLFLLQERLIYFPIRRIATTPASIGLTYDTVAIDTADGLTLSGWFIPAEGANQVLLFFHGNAGNISHRLESIRLFHQLGLNVLIIDYRGYGQSQGRPSEYGTYADAEATWQYLVDRRQVEPENIIIFGRSLGGAVATRLAQNHPPRALIIESTFTSVADMAAKQFPFLPARPLTRVGYNTLERLPQVKTPVLVVHSPDDEVIPYSHGERLFAAASEPKQFLKIRGGHNEGIFVSAETYQAGLKTFLTEYGGL